MVKKNLDIILVSPVEPLSKYVILTSQFATLLQIIFYSKSNTHNLKLIFTISMSNCYHIFNIAI